MLREGDSCELIIEITRVEVNPRESYFMLLEKYESIRSWWTGGKMKIKVTDLTCER